ncbi:MAG: hypothetical protein AAGL98_06315, partial [Planctomycetota bacterium]
DAPSLACSRHAAAGAEGLSVQGRGAAFVRASTPRSADKVLLDKRYPNEIFGLFWFEICVKPCACF